MFCARDDVTLFMLKIMLERTRENQELWCSKMTLNYSTGNENGGHRLIQDAFSQSASSIV